MSSPTFQSQADHHSYQAGISTSIKAAVDSPTTLTIHPSDLSNLVIQLKQALKDEISETITETIRSCLKHEIESCVKEAMHFLIQEIDSLKVENSKLKGDIDALEQYSRRELIRFSGINETSSENTTNIVTNIVKSIDPDFADGDISAPTVWE